MDDLEIYLQDLLLFENEPVKSEITIKRIFELFRKEQSGESINLLIFQIFGKNGIISFIERKAMSEESKSCILSAYQMLEFLLVNYKSYSIPYVCKVVEHCLLVVQSCALAKIKENSIKLLKCVFTAPFLGILPISEIITIIKEIRNRSERIQPSVLSQLFSVMGILFETFPEISHGESDEFLNVFLNEIEISQKRTSLIEGCLNGIYGYLVNFLPSEKKIIEIYSILKDYSVLKTGKKTRRIIERATLRIVERHYRIFARNLYDDIKFWRETLEIWMNKTTDDRQLGFAAMVSVYRAIAYVFETSNEEIGTGKLNEIVEEMLEELTNTFRLVSMAGVVELVSTGYVREDLGNRVFQLLTKRFNIQTNNLLYLSFNLECITKYMSKSTNIKSDHLLLAERIAVALIDNYPSLEPYFQRRSLEALGKSFHHLRQCGDAVLDKYTEEVIYQGLIRNCSHQISTDVDLMNDIADMDIVSYKSCLPIWLYLLNPSSSGSGSADIVVSEKILDKYISSFLKINKKLDLRIELKNPQATDPEEAGEAVRPNDFKIFINNVSLFVDVMEDMKNPDVMSKWLPWIFTETINSSYRSPLISGCYKVITSCLKIADKIAYFWDPFSDQLMQSDSGSDLWFRHLQKLLQDVAVKVGGYKGELQISCFHIFLSAPVKLVEPFLRTLIPTFRIILSVGSRNLPILRECLATLERWYIYLGKQGSSSKESVEYLLKNILPYLNVFLQSRESEHYSIERVEMKWKSLKMKGKIQKFHSGEFENELLNLQRKFLHFLGMLDHDVCKELIRPIDDYYNDDDEMGDWSKKLSYDLPLTDMKLRIHLDELLPRIILLSLSCTDRQIRLNACEFLHSTMLLTIGKMKQMNGELNGLLRKLVSTCLILGCDSDLIVFQLFEPLVMQMVHYFANKERESSHVFINCLMESVSAPFNPTLREFAGKLIREFTEWTIKDQDPEETPRNLKLILKIMYSFIIHPDHNKRCGAAIIFNNISSIMQEETDLLNIHWFLIYYHFMECLNMCSIYDDTIYIINAVKYIITLISDKSLNSQVKVPNGFNDNSVDSILKAVFSRCSHPQANIRTLSMSLFESIQNYSIPLKEFVKIYGYKVYMKPEYTKENSSVKEYISWLENITTIFSYYDWLLTHKAITEIDFQTAGIEIFLEIFLDNLYPSHPWFEIHTKRILAIIQMLQFIKSCIKIGIIWHTEKILSLIKTCLFTPSEFNFELSDVENHEKIESIFVELLPHLNSRLSRSEMSILVNIKLDFSRLNLYLQPDKSLHEIVERVNGLKMIHRLGLWQLGFDRMIIGDDILKSVFDSVFQIKQKGILTMNIRPDEKMFLEDLLRFAAKIGISLDTVLELLANPTEIYDVNTSLKRKKGEFFKDLFKEFICDYLITNSETSLHRIFVKFQNAVELIIHLLKHVNFTISDRENFIYNLCHKCPLLEELTHNNILLLTVVKLMCTVDADIIIKENQICFLVYQIMEKTNNFEEITTIFELIPYLSKIYEDSNDKLIFTLNIFYKNHKFFSSEINSFDPLIAIVYAGLVKGFSRKKSLPLLKEIIKLLIKYDSLLNEYELDNILNDICQSKVPVEHLHKILLFLYKNMIENANDSSIYHFFLEKLLKKCEREIVWTFFLNNLKDAVNVLNCGNLTVNISILKVFQTCLGGMKKKEMENTSASDKAAFKNFILICLKKEVGTDSDPELRRKYFCVCFNTLCTIVAAKSNDSQQYKCLIFKDDFSVLQYLINRDKIWDLRMDFDELPKRMKVLTSIRKTITQEKQMKFGRSINSVKYLEDETLFNSSLHEDITKFDCSKCFIRSAVDYDREVSPWFDIELEMDDLNKHECMATIIGIIEHMIDTKITPEDSQSVPFWLLSIMNRMTSFLSSKNEKIFLLKLICNIERYVKPYAENVIPGLLNTLIDAFSEKPINYLLIDVMVMIFSWKPDLSNLKREIQATITHLTIYIVNKSDSYRENIIKSNIEIVKLIVETCKDIVNIRILSECAFKGLMKINNVEDSTIYTNLQFCGVLLANSIPPWLENNEEEFILMIIQLFNKSEKLKKLAAQICGFTLNYLKNMKCFDKLFRLVINKIENDMLNKGLNNLSLVYNIFKNFKEISSYFVNSVRVCAWTIKGPFQVISLEMLLEYLKTLDFFDNQKFDYFIYGFLEDICTTDDLEVLNLSLKIVETVLRIYDKKMITVIEKVLTFCDCKMSDVRITVYNIAIMICDGWENRFSHTMNESILKQCKVLLLNGMNDNEFDSREKCLQFWIRRINESNSIEQFSSILRDVYTVVSEDSFLNFATRLMIRSSMKAADYQTFIFEHPLVQNSSFNVRNILKTVQTSTIVPMFAQTLTGQLKKSDLLKSLSSTPNSLQTLFFQGTIQQGEEKSNDLDKDKTLKRKRFIRNLKDDLYFVKLKKMKKASLQRKEKMKNVIELMREYSDGDFPNIQITHQDLLKPLEMLTMRDPQMGRYFLTCLYDGFMEQNPNKLFFEKIRQFIQNVIEESTQNNPSFIAFLFHVLLRCNGRIEIDTEWVTRLAKSSGCLSLGKLLIEESIIRAEYDDHIRDRRLGITPEEIKWLNLAEICRELKEFEIIRGIFLYKLSIVDEAGDAIRFESVSNWFKASEFYKIVLKRSLRSVANFYEDAYSNCLARLSDWTELSNHIKESYHFEDLWSDLTLFGKILPWFMKSETMRSILSDGGKSIMELIKKIENNPDKVSDLKKFFAEESAIAHFSQGNFDWLNYYLYHIYKDFLSSWSHWTKWSNTLSLMELQLPWELESCSFVLINAEETVSDLLDHWSRNRPRDADDLLIWDKRLTCRNHFLSMIETFHPDIDKTEIVKSSILSDFDMVKSGIAQQNLHISEKYIDRIRKRMKLFSNNELELMQKYYTSSLEILRLELFSSNQDVRCVGYAKTVHHLQEISDIKGTFSFESYSALSRIMDLLMADIDNVSENVIQEIGNQLQFRLDNIKEDIESKKLRYLMRALENSNGDIELMSKTFMKIVKHCRSNIGYTKEMASFLLRAMIYRNQEARQLFCCLLNEPKFVTDWMMDLELRSICKNIPTWMYLIWTNQILANLDSEMFPFLKEILLCLASEYPNSIRYSFALSKETYKFTNIKYGEQCRLFVNELSEKLLSDSSYTNLLTALSYITPPDLVFKYDLDILITELNQIQPDWDRMRKIICDLHKRMYGEEYKIFRGSIFDCLKCLKPDMEMLISLTHEKQFWMEIIRKMMKALPKVNMENSTLKSYSPWLYRTINHNATFELPCQQDRDNPILNRSVTIWSFKSNILVMKSKCRPIRITMIGNDAREYKFLVKFGEDLRQDQRIQQVFGHMNQLLRGSQHTSNLYIDTYNVLPLKCNLGMIEWVNNTTSLYELLTKTDDQIKQKIEIVQQEHLQFLAQDNSINGAISAHLNGYLNINRTEAVARFNERVHSFEWDLLRKAFWKMSLCPEQFVYLRNNFAISQAVIYIAHWLIGIGDRHLDNTLISSANGRALGIDFGCAFGFATEFLIPPELLPFRLTPQIVNFMKPMGENVLIKETMIQCLRAFRRERSILIAELEVFATEPTLDWLEKTKRDHKSRYDGFECNDKWNPREKITAVKEKLQGVNPVKIFTNDLISGHSNSHYLEKYLDVLHGDGSRSHLNLFTEQEQVNCLIELATDPHILCKTYVGWNPWL